MTTEFKVLGLDVSKSSITCHVLTEYPKGGIRGYWDKTRNKLSTLYPVFWAIPDNKGKKKLTLDFISWCEEIKPDYAVIEPTGVHYSRVWEKILESLRIKILWVGHAELRRHRASKNLPNKSDHADALALASYPFDPDHRLEDGKINLKYFLIEQPKLIGELREVVQQLEHLNAVQSPIINYARQRLSWEFPEKALSKSETSQKTGTAPLWAWLSIEHNQEMTKSGKTRIDNTYNDSIAKKHGIEIDSITRVHADWLCDISLYESKLEKQVEKILCSGEFSKYMLIFTKFGFGTRTKAKLLTRIYPFQTFLSVEGKEVIEYEIREVKKQERERIDGKNIIKYSAGEEKRIRRNRSRDMFKLRMGMGTNLEQSGDKLVEKNAGSSLCRIALWQYVLVSIETGRLPTNEITNSLITYRDYLKSLTDAQGKPLLNGKHIQGKLMSKTINLLYAELVKELRV